MVEQGSRWQVLLIRRSAQVTTHKGQWALPGGRYEEEDPDLLTTALRETDEELGIPPHLATPLGELPPHPTSSSGFLIHPFVAHLTGPLTLAPDPEEVAEVMLVPLAFFCDPDHCVMEELDDGAGKTVNRPSFRYGPHRIWGATAAILHHFSRTLREGGAPCG